MLKILFALLLSLSFAQAETYWNLPKKLNPQNTTLNYELDTTWHMVHGKVEQLEGEVHLAQQQDYKSIRAKVKFNVSAMDSDNEDRDEEMRQVMTAETFPQIVFNLTSIDQICSPEELNKINTCKYSGQGKITIRDISANLPISGEITKTADGYEISGETQLKWADFGISDPSIFIAKVYADVNIKFVLKL